MERRHSGLGKEESMNQQKNRVKMRGQPIRDNAVGFCYHSSHTGWLTEKMTKQHNCLGKRCKYFRKLESSSYWYKRDIKKVLRKIKKNGYGIVTIDGDRYLIQDYTKLCRICNYKMSKTNCLPIIEYSKL